MRYFPRVNRTEVSTAPTHTSDQAGRAWGRTLKIIANISVVSANERTRFVTWSQADAPANQLLTTPDSPATTALMTRDTRSRKARPQTSENDIRRSFTMLQTPPGRSSSRTQIG